MRFLLILMNHFMQNNTQLTTKLYMDNHLNLVSPFLCEDINEYPVLFHFISKFVATLKKELFPLPRPL